MQNRQENILSTRNCFNKTFSRISCTILDNPDWKNIEQVHVKRRTFCIWGRDQDTSSHLRQARAHLLHKTQHKAEKPELKQAKPVSEPGWLMMEHYETPDSPAHYAADINHTPARWKLMPLTCPVVCRYTSQALCSIHCTVQTCVNV